MVAQPALSHAHFNGRIARSDHATRPTTTETVDDDGREKAVAKLAEGGFGV